MRPFRQIDLIGLIQVVGKHGFHLVGKVAAQNDCVHFIIVQKAAPIQVG